MTMSHSIAERIERLPASRYMTKRALIIAFGTFWDSYMLFSIGSIAVHFLSSVHEKQLTARLPLALFAGTFLGAVLLSRLADKIGRKNAFALDLAILAFGDLIAVVTSSADILLLALFIAGLGTGAELPLSTTYVQELSPASRRGRMTSIQLTFGFFGGTVGGFAALWLVPIKSAFLPGFRIALLIPVIGALITIVLRLRLPESPRWLERVGRAAQADSIVTVIENAVMAEKGLQSLPDPVALPEVNQQEAMSTKILFSMQYLRRTISAWTIELFQGFGAYGFTTFVPIVLYARGYSVVHALFYTAIIQIAYPVGTAISVFVTDRIQRKWGMAWFYFLNMLTGLAFFFVRSTPFVVLFGFLTELLIFLDGPLLHAYEAEIYPTGVRARGAGISFSLSRLGGFLAPSVGTLILTTGGKTGYIYLIALASAAWLLCAIVSAVVAVDTTGIALEKLEISSDQSVRLNISHDNPV